MSNEDPDYEMEYETLQAQLLPFADHILAQLDDARRLADRQRADRSVIEWLNKSAQHSDTRPPSPLVSRIWRTLGFKDGC